MMAQRNNLSTTIPVAPGTGTLYSMIWDFRPGVGAQMVNVCYGGQACGAGDPATALTASIQNGLAYGQKFIEIYQSDVNYYPAVITWAHAALNAQ